MLRVTAAQSYPSRPVRIVVGVAAGGANDTIGAWWRSGSPSDSLGRSSSKTGPALAAWSAPFRERIVQ